MESHPDPSLHTSIILYFTLLIIFTSCSSKASEPKTWNVELFIEVVHELQPTLHWKEIIYDLDHPGFAVKDRQGLILLVGALKRGLQVCSWDLGPL